MPPPVLSPTLPQARPRAHLAKGAPRAEELVDDVGRHQDHGGARDAPPDPVGPEWEDVVIVGERLEIDDAHDHHKLGGRDRRKRERDRERGERGKEAGERERCREGPEGSEGQRVRWMQEWRR